MIYKNAEKPFLILDENRCKKNIERIAKRSKMFQCEFRPHFKTHQSITVGKWFRDFGVTGITVSSPGMAHYFVKDGWDDITIAFPFYPAQIPALKGLENKSKLRLFVNNIEHLEMLDRELKEPFHFMIEIDSGYGRSGISIDAKHHINSLVEKSKGLSSSNFYGFYIHDGRTYHVSGKTEVEMAIEPSLSAFNELKSLYPSARLSLGDTPSASLSDNLDRVDEITPGNLVFYDWMQVQIGSCSVDDISLFAVLPVAQIKDHNNSAILHGGAAHLSKDFVLEKGNKNFGQCVDYTPGEDVAIHEKSYISALSQEHATLPNLHDKSLNTVIVAPIHSCLTANLFDHYLTPQGKRIEKRVLS